jgi:RND family efflux transporter MFP subunit
MPESAQSLKPDLTALRIEEKARVSAASSRTGRVVLFALVLGVCLAGAIAIYVNRRPEVEVASVKPAGKSGPATLLNASGYVTPRRRATIAPKITARVAELLVEEGVAVQTGQLLARLDDTDAKKRLLATRAARQVAASSVGDLQVTLTAAERELKRQLVLQGHGVSSDQALDNARTAAESTRARLTMARDQVKSADANVAIAQLDLESCQVVAPFAGIVVSKDAQVGEMVSPISAGGFTRTGIATIVDMTSLEVEVDVNESYIARVKVGQRVEATLDAYPDWQIPAKVRTVIPTADRQKATVKVRIAFDQLDPRILPDMGVKVAFLAEKSGEAAIATRALLPAEALRERDGKKLVFVLADDQVERRAVSVGASRDEGVEIVAGVSPGEQVVTQGPGDLSDGQKVRVKRAQ